jgi:hypothetical protein
MVQGFVHFLVVVLNQDGDLLLDQVRLVFDDGDDLVNGFRDGDGHVLNHGHNHGSGHPHWHWDGVGLGDGHGFGHVHQVGLGYLDRVGDGDGFRDGEGLGHGHGLEDGVRGKHVLNDGHNDVFGYKFSHGKGLKYGVRLRDGNLFVDGIRFWDRDMFRDVLYDDFYGSRIFYVTPVLIVVIPSSGHEPQKGYQGSQQ